MISRNDLCWCGSKKKWKKCHYPKTLEQATSNQVDYYLKNYGIILKDKEQIEKIKIASTVAAIILDKLCIHAKEGVTTEELDQLSMKLHKEMNATPAPLHYGSPPYPKSICTSINEVICHGIPGPRKLIEGDIMNIDVTSIVDGYYGDCSKMVAIGKIDPEKQKVIDVSYESMMRAISICGPNVPISKIGEVIEEYATSHGCTAVNQFVGHGIGVGFHEPPQIPFCTNDIHIPMIEGMTFTIEPMINAGVREAVIDRKDGWTATTKDKKPSAQFEHTLLITKSGAEILSIPPK